MTTTTVYVELSDRVFRVDAVSLRPGHVKRRVKMESGRDVPAEEWPAVVALVAANAGAGERE